MKKRRIEIDVEPLPDRRWAAIEERVLDRAGSEQAPQILPRRRPRAAGAAAAIAAVAAAVALAWWARTPEDRSVATSRIVTSGDVTHTSAGDVAIEVAPRSSVLVLERARDAWLVSIEHGAASFRVPPRRDRPPFVVEAGLVRVEVVGTAFTVSRPAGEASARVSVDEGTVRVSAGGAATLVHAGERWPAEPVPATSARSTPPSSPPPAPPPPEAPPEADDEDRPRAAARSSSVERAAEGPSAHERFARAVALERTAPDTALREYAALAREGGAWGANALFARGRLELELGHRDRARALLERYLAQHPEGPNAEDARALLERIR